MRRAALSLILLVSCAQWKPPVQEAELRTPDQWETVSDRRAWELITADDSYARFAADPEQLRPVRGPRSFVLPGRNALVVIYPDRPATVAKLDPSRQIDPLSPRELRLAYALAFYRLALDLQEVPPHPAEAPPDGIEEDVERPR